MYIHGDKNLVDSHQYRNSTPLTGQPITSSQQLPPYSPFVHSPEQFGIPINYSDTQRQFASYHHQQQLQSPPFSESYFGSSDSAVQPKDYTDRNTVNELEFRFMNIASHMSPSSSITSPMDLGFANIEDEQSNDDIDLNNITPSIKLASSLTLLESNEFSGNRQNASGEGNRRSAGKPRIKSDDLPTNLRLHEFSRTSSRVGDLRPSGSCPDSIRPGSLPYPGVGGPYESPTNVGLAIPQAASGGSASSGAGTWTGGSNITSPSGESMARVGAGLPLLSTSMSSDNQHVAMLRARNKKDSHNRIERKRRDYINGQISELGTLLPEEMFRENGLAVLENRLAVLESECKKNKGTILKNSVEYICTLRAENACFSELRKEAHLATNLIPKLVKYIQDLESILPPEYLSKTTSLSEYAPQLQEWSSMHDSNQQLHQHVTGLSSPVSRTAATGFVSVDTSESSPGMSSLGNEDLGYPDTKGDSCSSIPNRTRCTSLSSPGQSLGNPVDKVDSGRSLISGVESTSTPFGSLPTSRRLQQLLPTRPPLSAANTTTGRSMLSSSSPYGGGGSLKHTSPLKLVAKPRTTKALISNVEEARSSSGLPMNAKGPLFSGGGGFSGGLSSSLPVRMAPGEFIADTGGNVISEMESDDILFRLSESGENTMNTAFKLEPMMDSAPTGYSTYSRFNTMPQMTASQAADFSLQIHQQNQWAAASNSQSHRPISAGGPHVGNPEMSPSLTLGDELQFDTIM